ncbi:MAG: Holliday junction ATP-dependent DNA helicase RuvA [Endomicrobiia bacterium]|nr:Holliday junction ATP-dependent DNA helicase RuvA [Endomicrobiia bacterium]
MIASLKGRIAAKTSSSVVLEAAGIGWEIMTAPSTSASLPSVGADAMLFISESTAMYGGGTTLYGFSSPTEKEIFELLREVPGTGARKALEHLDKIKKSPSGFKKAVIGKDVAILTGVFGFKKPTAEKIAVALKKKIEDLALEPEQHESRAAASGWPDVAARAEALAVLIALGYREGAARQALDEAVSSLISVERESSPGVQELVRTALKALF